MEKKENILYGDIRELLDDILSQTPCDRLFILADDTTAQLCLPKALQAQQLQRSIPIYIGAGDEHKTLDSLSHVWQKLSDEGASRHSRLVNIGGGMVTDLGGMAASTFKRGIAYINVPTTLLAMVDASVGGKTGINFNGLKNEVGVFSSPRCVIIDTGFLRTLNTHNFYSGYAEMLKHGLISDTRHWADLLSFDTDQPDYALLSSLIRRSVEVKENIVRQDPHEQGLRKALNFGHTVGHAFESLSLQTGHPVLHGYAVAWGMVCELYLSYQAAGFPKDKMWQTLQFIKEHYGSLHFDCTQYNRLYELMTHDKKNTEGNVNFTLLSDIGDIQLNRTADQKAISELLDFYRDFMGE